MFKFATITVFATGLMLGGCQYNGTIDASNLLIAGERIIISKEKANEALKPQISDEAHYYYIIRSGGRVRSSHSYYEDYLADNLPELTTLDSKFGNIPKTVQVQGESALFIQYNSSNSDNLVQQYYVVTGGIPNKDDFTTLPSGSFGYTGKIVTVNALSSNFSNGTLEAQVNFDSGTGWVEFAGTDIFEIDRKFDNLFFHDGWLSDHGYINYETGVVSNQIPQSNQHIFEYSLGADLLGAGGIAMEGYVGIHKYKPPEQSNVYNSNDLKTKESILGLFVAKKK